MRTALKRFLRGLFDKHRLYFIAAMLALPVSLGVVMTVPGRSLMLSKFVETESGKQEESLDQTRVKDPVLFLEDFTRTLTNRWYDALVRARYKKGVPSNYLERISLVGITDESVVALGGFPFPRNHYAKLLDVLDRGQAGAIVMDLLFDVPRSGDKEFAKALRRKNNRFLAYYTSTDSLSGERKATMPCSEILGSVPSNRLGYVSFDPDPDAMVRRIAPIDILDGKTHLHIGLLVASWLWGERPESAEYYSGKPFVFLGKTEIPLEKRLDETLSWPIDFKANPERLGWLTVNFHEVLAYSDEEAKIQFKDKIVFVGPTALGIEDLKATPLGKMYGVKCQINILDAMVNKRFIRHFPSNDLFVSRHFEILVIVMSGILLSLVLAAVRKTLWCACIGAAMVGALCLGSYLLFVYTRILIPIISESLNVLGVTFVIIAYVEFLVRRTFKDFVPDVVVERIIARRSVNSDVEASVLFCDIRGFTTLSEQTQSKEMIEIVNEFHKAMTDAWSRFQGYRFDFQGDAQMVVFGAIEHYTRKRRDDHALLAVKSALAMQYGLEILREKWIQEGRPIFEMGVGIHTGIISMGVVGGSAIGSGHKQFTAIGDIVNTSSRIQGLSNVLESPIIVTAATYEAVKDRIWATPLGEVDLKGKAEKVFVYRVNGFLDDKDFQEFRKGAVDVHVRRLAQSS